MTDAADATSTTGSPADETQSATDAAAAGSSTETIGSSATDTRPADLRLARIHLRTGALALARAELEMLAGQDRLDSPGVVDLAEVRWRTGDLAGAGEAANAALTSGSGDALAFVIAAEAAASQDKPAEARRLAGRALERTTATLESIFAGIPRSSVWPHDSWAEPAAAAEETTEATPETAPRPRRFERSSAGQAGLWEAGSAAWTSEIDVEKRLAAAHRALEGGDRSGAAVHLALVLRFAPGSADAVLDAIAGFEDATLEVIRGDALRLVGSEWEARRAYVAASRAAPTDTDRAVHRGAVTEDGASQRTPQQAQEQTEDS